MEKILVIRLSALGDVAICAPVVNQFLKQWPDKEILFLTREKFIPVFENNERLQFLTPDFKLFKGFFGILKFYRLIITVYNINLVIDLHDVLRTKLLRLFFRLSGIKTFKINKGRSEKRKLTQRRKKTVRQLQHSSERYAAVFEKAGFKIGLNFNINKSITKLPENVLEKLNFQAKNIGIAPFAMHKQKSYPIEKMENVIREISPKGIKVFIFGGGKNEKEIAEDLEKNYENVFSLISKFDFETELKIISNLDLMLTMDSANMHLASLSGTKVISVWGATHPFAGFYPFGQNIKENFIQISENDLPCRPCSVFGNKKCHRKDLACLNSISPDLIVERILANI